MANSFVSLVNPNSFASHFSERDELKDIKKTKRKEIFQVKKTRLKKNLRFTLKYTC